MKKITVKNGEVIYNDLRSFCFIGREGLTEDKSEGDFKTPIGIFPIRKIYFRKDKIEKFKCFYNLEEITPDMGWCDDSNSDDYNKLITLPNNFHHEKMYRDDNLYNIVVVLGYNDDSVIKNKGSAIFLHVADNITFTEGCVATEQNELIELLKNLSEETVVEILK